MPSHILHRKTIRFLFIFLLHTLAYHSQMKVMTYNIRYDNPNDGNDRWAYRKDAVVNLLKNTNPSIIGFQEALPNQTKYLAQQLPGYGLINYLRDGNESQSEGLPVFYDQSVLTLVESSVFWLSETPEVISKGWDASLNRIAVYVVFQNKETKQTLHLINVHFDHQGSIARQRSAELLLSILKENNLNHQRVVILGDLNALPGSPPIQILSKELQDSQVLNPKETGTFNGFDLTKREWNRIDYIFTKNIEGIAHQVLTKKRPNGRYPSDHFPVMIALKN